MYLQNVPAVVSIPYFLDDVQSHYLNSVIIFFYFNYAISEIEIFASVPIGGYGTIPLFLTTPKNENFPYLEELIFRKNDFQSWNQHYPETISLRLLEFNLDGPKKVELILTIDDRSYGFVGYYYTDYVKKGEGKFNLRGFPI